MIIKNIFNRYLVLALTLVFTSAAVWAAPTPVAVWGGDFKSASAKTTDGITYTLDPRGNLVTENALTINQTTGNSLGALITISDTASFGSSGVILIKYKSFTASPDQRRALMSYEVSNGNRGGVRMKAAGNGTIDGCIEGAGDYNGCTTSSAIGESGYLLMSAKMGSGGTSVYYGATLASLSGGHGSQLQWSGKTISKFSVGGAINSATNPSADGLVIEGIAIFKGIHYTGGTTTDFADFVFPEPKEMKYYFPLDGDATNLGTASIEGKLDTDGTPTFADNSQFGSKALSSGNGQNVTGSYVLADESNGLVGYDTGWTLSFWVNPNGMNQWRDLCGFNIGDVQYKLENVANGDNAFQIYNNKSFPSLDTPIPYTPNKWQNIVITSLGDNSIKIYANGTEVVTWNPGGENKIWGGSEVHALTKLIMGTKGLNDQRPSPALTANYAIYNYVVNNEQIAQLAAAEPIDFFNVASSSLSTTIEGNVNWSDLVWSDGSKTVDWQDDLIVNIEVAANSTLAIDTSDTINAKAIIFSGSGNVDVVGAEKLPLNLNASGLTGTFTLVIDASNADVTPSAEYLSFVRTSGNTFKFLGSETTGVHLDYNISASLASQMKSHLIFESGVHTMKYRNNAGNLFATGHTDDNPTVLVKNGATLNFTANDLSGWSGGANITGVIRVNEGGRLNFIQNGSETFFYRQRLYLDPGAYVSHNFGLKSGEGCFRWQGGTSEETAQIYVPASTSDQTNKPAVIEQKGASALVLASDQTRGLAMYVGENSKLQIKSEVRLNTGDAALHRYGEGILEFTKAVDIPTLNTHAGSLVFAPTEEATFRVSGALSGNLTINAPDTGKPQVNLPSSYTGNVIVEAGRFELPTTALPGSLTIQDGALLTFPESYVPGETLTLCNGTFTYHGQSTGSLDLTKTQIYVGSVMITANATLNLDNKTASYTIPTDSTLTRRADPVDATDEQLKWTAEGSWIDAGGNAVNWPVEGVPFVNIDADQVSKIIVDTKVKADMITLTNTASEEGSEFRFETLEDLGEVALEKEDPDYVINGKLSAAGFAGKLYLQARISDAIALGDETRVIFVAGIDENKSDEENAAEETTAYPYTFSNLQHPIGKVGLGTFIVPSSMYGYAFNIDNGTISYNTPGEVNGVVTCQTEGIGQIAVNAGDGNSVTISADNSSFTGSVLVRSGTLKMGHNKCLGAYGVNRAIRVKTGAALDMNGMSNGYSQSATYCLTLEEGATYKNSAAHHSDIKAAFPISKLVLEGDATINCDGFACGLSLHFNNSTAIELGEHTLEIIGNQPAYMSCPQVTGTGKILVTSGGLRLAHNSGAQPRISDGTLEIASGATLDLENYTAGTKPVVKNLVLNGSVNCLSANCSITVNGLISGIGLVGGEAEGVGKLILGPEAKYDGSSLTPEFLTAAQVGQPLPLITAKTSITYGAGFAAVNLPTGWEIYHTDTEIGIINTTNGLILNSETLDLTDGHFQEIPLGPTHNNAKIKITRPAKFIKIAAVVEGVTSIPTGLTIIDENAEDITADCVVHDGVIYFGKLHSETEYTFTSEQLESFESGATGIMQDIDPMTVIAPTELTFTNLPENALAKIIDNRLLLIKKTNSISIKFGPRGATEGHIGELDENVGGFPVVGIFWNHSKDYNNNDAGTTEIFKVKDGNGEVLANTRVFYYMPNSYLVNAGSGLGGRNKQTTGNGKLTYSYFDDSERLSGDNATAALTITQDVDGTSETRVLKPTPTGKLFWEVGISDVPYQIFDLYIYQASDQTAETISLLPIGVKANDGEWKYFAGDGHGSTIAATADTRWNGAAYCDSETMVEGTNYIRYRMSAAALGLAAGETIENIYLTYPDKSNGRLGLAGIQLVEVEDDGLYTRQADPADMGGDDDERNVWTRENSWKKSNGSVINWPTEGERNVTINADEVKAIKVNDVITANGVTVKNSDTSYTLDEHEFKFLTLEDLGDVATPNDNPDYILNAPVDATGFCGDLYLQSRISGMVSLGANTHITFVAMNEGEETTAYPYNFSGTINPIRKIGLGTFIVPGSMYNVGFNIDNGFIRFNDNGTYTGTITGNKPVIVTASDFKMNSNSQFVGASEVIVKDGASFDQNGLSGASTTVLTLDGGSFVNNKAVNGLDSTYSNHAYPIKTLNVTKDSTIGGTQHFGLVGGQWSAVTMNMSNDVTLSKTGTNVFAVVNLTINGNGTINVQGGTFATRRSAVSATDATIIVHDGATLDVGSDLSVGTLAGDGTLVGSGRLSVKAIDTTKGSDIITIPEGFNIDLPDILTAVVNDDSAPILSGITEGIKLPTYIQIKTNGQPMKYQPVVRDGMLYAEKINVEGIIIPTIEHTTVTVKADGQLVEPDSDNMISVMEGTKLEVTYTAEEGYYIKNGTISFVVLSSKDNTIDISKVIVSDQPLTIIPIVLIETKGTKLWIKDGIVDEEGLAIEGNTLIVHAEIRAGYSSLALMVNDTPVTLNGSGDAEITVLAPATFIKTTCTKNN
ncbi:MAG: LamG domain-containing protein [Kiritimatiellae bacterium]|nr:LamG domain-containing protein [Kiritimatiellia bacterium]